MEKQGAVENDLEISNSKYKNSVTFKCVKIIAEGYRKKSNPILTITIDLSKWWNPFSWRKKKVMEFECTDFKFDSGDIFKPA